MRFDAKGTVTSGVNVLGRSTSSSAGERLTPFPK